MLVIDASAWVEVALGRAGNVLLAAMGAEGHWVVPEHFRTEAFSALRGLWLGKALGDEGFELRVRELAEGELDVWPTRPLLPRMRELAANATAYDAAYLALAEELGCPLATADRKLASVPGVRCRVLSPD